MVRPKKPAAIKQIEGNRSRRPIPKEWAAEGAPPCPKNLPPRAEAHFMEVCESLAPIGVVRQTDGRSLETMARLWDAMIRAFETGQDDIACKLVAKWSILAGKFGMTPSDRQKIIVDATNKPDEDEERFFGRVVG